MIIYKPVSKVLSQCTS